MWQQADDYPHEPLKGSFMRALASIEASIFTIASRTDLYLPLGDSVEEVKHLQDGQLKIIETVWGGIAGGGGGNKEDIEFIYPELGQ